MSRLCSSRFERAARKLGWMRIAGIDEAGRGALFGPVVAAAVILNPKRRIVGLDDSKSSLPNAARSSRRASREHALAWAVAEVDAQRIDALGNLPGVAPGDDRSAAATGNSAGLPAY